MGRAITCPHGLTPKKDCVECRREVGRLASAENRRQKKYSYPVSDRSDYLKGYYQDVIKPKRAITPPIISEAQKEYQKKYQKEYRLKEKSKRESK